LGIKAVTIVFCLIFCLSASPLEANPQAGTSMVHVPLRSLNELFPDLTREQRRDVFSATGLKNTFLRREAPLITPASYSGIDLISAAMQKRPTQLIEALIVIPYRGRTLNKLDAYNAIGRIEEISTYTVYSPSRGGQIPLFERSTRLDNGNRNRPISDPPPATILPSSETVYILLRDTFFGNTYFRGDLSINCHGITYNLTNNVAVLFTIFPVMRAERFITTLYVEPIREGMLVYGVAGIDIPEFLVTRINFASQIDVRLAIFINWLRDGLRSIY
jgi:hypothetical protein